MSAGKLDCGLVCLLFLLRFLVAVIRGMKEFRLVADDLLLTTVETVVLSNKHFPILGNSLVNYENVEISIKFQETSRQGRRQLWLAPDKTIGPASTIIHLDAVAQEQLKHARCTSSSSSTLQCLAGVINAGLLRGGGRKPCSAAPVPYLVSTLLQSCPGLEVGVQCLHVCRGNSLQCGKYDYVDSYPVLCKSILK
ncbi:hypothetical protein J6590_102488, partial [Homalodisca vitripennis]